MNEMPNIDQSFDLKKAIVDYGFKVDEKNEGVCIGYGFFYHRYGEIWIEFFQSFVTNYPFDMRVLMRSENETLYKGVAPTNKHDFDTLMQLLFPTEDFISVLDQRFVDITIKQ